MATLTQLRRPGRFPWSMTVPRSIRAFAEKHAVSPLQLLEVSRQTTSRQMVLQRTGVTDRQLQVVIDAIQKRIPKSQAGFQSAPVIIPPLSEFPAKAHAGDSNGAAGIYKFWKSQNLVLPRSYNHLDFFAKFPVITQKGPDCVGHACGNAAASIDRVVRRSVPSSSAPRFAERRDTSRSPRRSRCAH